MARTAPTTFRAACAALLFLLAAASCKSKNAADAEANGDVTWLAEQGTADSVAALGRLADKDPRALSALEARSQTDVNVYIAAWGAVTRNAPWGANFIRAALADPTRAEVAVSAMPRRDPRLIPFIGDLENAIVRLSAGRSGSVIAGVLATVGPQAHAAVERRLLDPKTRGAMCDGIGLPEASGDAKSLVLAIPADARDNPSCVRVVLDMAATEDVVIGWLATGAEPGLINAAAKGTLACPRLAAIWQKALAERTPDGHAALTVPLQRSISRCTPVMDPVLAELLTKAPPARSVIMFAIDPFGGDLAAMPQTCAALKAGYANNESARVRERVRDAINRGCAFAR